MSLQTGLPASTFARNYKDFLQKDLTETAGAAKAAKESLEKFAKEPADLSDRTTKKPSLFGGSFAEKLRGELQ